MYADSIPFCILLLHLFYIPCIKFILEEKATEKEALNFGN